MAPRDAIRSCPRCWPRRARAAHTVNQNHCKGCVHHVKRGCCGCIGSIVGVALWLLLFVAARTCFAQAVPETLLVEVRLEGVGSRTVEARLTDSLLSLSAVDVRD